jgi:spore maturation protein CgeB
LAARECRYAISFVGSRYGNRVQWIEGLRQRGIEVECFGRGWGHGAVAGEEIPRIMRDSFISLNFGDSETALDGLRLSRSRQIKARIFEVPGCGGFLRTQPAEGLEQYFTPGREVATFGNLEDLAHCIGYYLAHSEERDQIARAGHMRTRAEHTYEIRFAQLLDVVKALRVKRTLAGNEVLSEAFGDELEEFRKAALRHRLHSGLRLLRKVLTTPCVLIWGQQRGPRAARRILFELSWRLCGETTYSAAGWPGRIFYRES